MVKLVYRSDINTYDVGSGEFRFYAMNNLFDPDITGAGGQPIGYDALAAKYQFYKVYGASIKASFSNGQSGAVGISEALVGTATSTTTPVWDQMEDQAGTRHKMIPALGSSGSVKSIRMYRKPRGTLGVNKKEYASANFGAAVTGNPVTQAYWIVGVRAWDRTTTTSIKGSVKLTYYCKFYGPKLLVGDT